uniref:Uncharacterized protein n=2 Tax=Daucus carota subsp. sativus TaxID=79200 RepID=A0A164SLU7_DAUCS
MIIITFPVPPESKQVSGVLYISRLLIICVLHSAELVFPCKFWALAMFFNRVNFIAKRNHNQGSRNTCRACCFLGVTVPPSTQLSLIDVSTSAKPFYVNEISQSDTVSELMRSLVLADLDPATAKLTITFLGPFLSAFAFLFIVRIVMSWYPKLPVGKFPYVLAYAPTEPILSLTRKVIPPLGGVDVTPVVWFGLVSFLNEILVGPQGLLVLLSQQVFGNIFLGEGVVIFHTLDIQVLRLLLSAVDDGMDSDDSDDEADKDETSESKSKEENSRSIRENLERIVGTDDSAFSGLDLATLIRNKYGRSYDVQLIKKEFMGKNLLAMNVMWKYVEQKSFPLTEEEYLLRLDDVANTLKCWGAVSHIRDSLIKSKERPRIGKVLSTHLGRKPEDIVKLDANENPYGPPPEASCGADELIDLIRRCVLEPGDKIVDCPPTFAMYEFDVAVNGALVIKGNNSITASPNLNSIE